MSLDVHSQFSRVKRDVARDFFQATSRAIDGRSLTMANSRAFKWLSSAISSVFTLEIVGAWTNRNLITNCFHWKNPFKLTFDFLLPQRLNLSSVHFLRCFAFGAARFDWIFVQIVGQPSQIAIANKWISCQMSVLYRELFSIRKLVAFHSFS